MGGGFPHTRMMVGMLGTLALSAQEPPVDLESELQSLRNVKVEVASKSSERLSDAPGIISVLSRDELQRFGGTTLADILQRVPGLVHVSNYFTDRSIIGARGDSLRATTTNRHVLVLIDGRPVREVQEGGIKSDVYEAFPVAAIDHIEVIKGPGSVLYGSEAYSAVINVVTERSGVDEGTVYGSFAQDGAYHHGAKARVSTGAWSTLAAVRVAKRADWPITYAHTLTPYGAPFETRDHTMVDSGRGAFIKSRYKGFQFLGAFLDWKPSHVIPDNLLQPPFAPLRPGDTELKKTFLDAGYGVDISPRWKMSANLTYNRSQYDPRSAAFPYIIRDSHEVLGEMTHFITFSRQAKLTVGALFSHVQGREQVKDPYILVSDGHRDGRAIYGQLDVQFLESLKGIAGFQTLKIGQSATKTVPRLGVIWYPASRLNIKVLYGQAFRAPYVNETMADFPGLKGTPTLKPETVTAYEVGATYLGDKLELGLSGFRNKQTNLIVSWILRPEDGRPTYINAGDAAIRGLEFEGKYYLLNHALYFTGSVLLQRSEDLPTGIADRSAKLGMSLSGEQGVLSVFSIMQGGLPDMLRNRQSPNPWSGAYHLLFLHGELDLNRTFQWHARPKFKLTLQGDNLLDKEIWVNALGDAWPWETIPFKKGRAVYVGLHVAF